MNNDYWTWDRTLVPGLSAFILLAVIMAPLGVYWGYLNILRYILCTFFFGGAVLSFIGYWRYMPPGPRIPALLLLLMVKSFIFATVGVAFLAAGIANNPQPVDYTFLLFATYACFAGAGAAKMFTGVYVFVGAGRGWIGLEVLKHPFIRTLKRTPE